MLSPRKAPPHRPPPPADVRAGPLMSIPTLLREAGIAPLPVLARCGIAPETFDDPEARVPFQRGACLIEECARLTGRADFGLLIGERFDFARMGMIALLMRHAPSVGAAIANLERYFHLHDRGAVPYLRRLDEGTVALGYALVRHDTPGAAMVVDTALAIAWRMLRALCGPQWRPTLAAFAHGRPERSAPWRQFFQAPLQFDATHSELQFDAAWLAAPIAGADALQLAAVQRAAERGEPGRERSPAERARATAQAMVLAGPVSAPQVAAALGVHERSLRRLLAAEGTNLKAIIGEARFEAACQLLHATRLPLGDIAAALHYADGSALSRAFKALAGEAPGAWRTRQQAGSAPQRASSARLRTRRST